ncbi:glycosyltransferase [Clostridium tertium]|uniref:glycosyltransferase n=1 Tax=Clostridium tertium TaxID=1559 RepID=UPI00189E24D0|nr:glycosyltransferase [Clostridium tertium]MDB1948000.1 glycosyltransferase [Clostridium tertium]
MVSDLVSVIVLTYNSEKFIGETLESILNQTYDNIEVIIADDCSKDNTLIVAKKFLEVYGVENFKIIRMDKNSGIPANCNNGIKNSNGKFIKIIAGDDILLPECISDNVEFVKNNNSKVQFSRVVNFIDTEGKRMKLKSPYRYDKKNNCYDSKKQLYNMIFRNYIPAPTVFFAREIFTQYGLFEEKYRFFEDYPMWIKLLYNGEKIYFLDKDTVLYRQHSNSLSNSSDYLINEKMFENLNDFINNDIIEILKKDKKYMYIYHKKIEILKMKFIINSGNKKGIFEKVGKLFNFLDPLWIVNKIK